MIIWEQAICYFLIYLYLNKVTFTIGVAEISKTKYTDGKVNKTKL